MVLMWHDVEDGTPENSREVIVDWTDNTTGESYFSSAIWDIELGGWVVNSTNNNFTIHRWREKV